MDKLKTLGRGYGFVTNPASPVDGNGPELWKYLIDIVTPYLPSGTKAVVAGGAVRDYALGLPPRDIDIFLLSENPAAGLLYEVALTEISKDFESGRLVDQGYKEFGAFFGKTYEIPDQNGEIRLVQIIIGDNDTPASDGKALLDKFDYSLVRVMYDPERSIIDSVASFPLDASSVTWRFNTGSGRSKHKESLSKTRFDAWRRRTGYGSREPSQWYSTEDLPAKSRVSRQIVKSQIPEGYEKIELEWSSSTFSEIGSRPEIMSKLTSVKKIDDYRWHRIGYADIERYRFIDI